MPAPSAYSARFGAAGSSSTIQCSAPKAASARNASPRAVGDRQRRVARERARCRSGASAVLIRATACHRRRRAGARGQEALAAGDLEHRHGGSAASPGSRGCSRRACGRGRAAGGRSAAPRRAPRGRGGSARRPATARSPRRAAPAARARPATPRRSFSTTCARRSPGSSSEQPLRRAKCTHSEAAARTALSSASCDAGARGSSTTSGRESASEISLRSIRPWPARDGGPVDARGGRAGPVLAQAVELGLGGRDQRHARVRGRRVAAAGGGAHRQHARQHEHLVAGGAGHDALGEPERVAQHERRRREPAAPAAAERDLDAHARASAGRRGSARAREQRLVDPAGRQRQPAGRARADADLQRLLLEHAAGAELAAGSARPRRRRRSSRRRRAPSSASAAPVTYSGSASNVPATTRSRTPRAAQPSAERIGLS